MKHDVVIPCHPKDVSTLGECVRSIQENISDAGQIYVVAQDVLWSTSEHPEIILVKENEFPFSVEDVSSLTKKGNPGWYWQQIIQYYLWDVIPELTEDVLVVDADVVWSKPLSHVHNGKYFFNYHGRIHHPYKEFEKRLIPGLKTNDLDGTCHYMVYNRDIVSEIRNKAGEPFWKKWMECASDDPNGSSEFDLYFQYVDCFHPDKGILRSLKYVDSWDWTHREMFMKEYVYAAFHMYMRRG